MRAPIPWLRLVVEGVIVIGSILIAFAIDAWWAGQQTHALEQELLSRLENSFEDNRRLASEQIGLVASDRQLLQRFIAMSPQEAERISPDSTYVFLRALWRPNDSNLNAVSILSTLDAGRMSVVSDPLLLAALAEWEAAASGLAERNEIVSALMQQVQEALARHPDLQPVLAQSERSETLPGIVSRAVREDNEVMARAARKGFATRIQILYLESVETAADEVLRLLHANLER
jgi:hypothetical protein